MNLLYYFHSKYVIDDTFCNQFFILDNYCFTETKETQKESKVIII